MIDSTDAQTQKILETVIRFFSTTDEPARQLLILHPDGSFEILTRKTFRELDLIGLIKKFK